MLDAPRTIPNPERRLLPIAYGSAGLLLVAFLALVLTPPGRDVLQGTHGFLWAVCVAALLAAAGVASIFATHHWRLFRRFTSPDLLLAVWTYSPGEWRALHRGSVFHRVLFSGLAMGFAVWLLGDTVFSSAASVATTVAVFVSLLAAAEILRWRQVRGPGRPCIISRVGAYIPAGGGYAPWQPPAQLIGVGFHIQDGVAEIRIEYESFRRIFRRSILVPAGREEEAQIIVRELLESA